MQYVTSPGGAGLRASLAPRSHRRFFKKFFKEKKTTERCAQTRADLQRRPAAIRRRVLRVLSLCTVRMRLNEHSACKVGGMFQNKHRFPASVMYARGTGIQPRTPSPPTCLHSDHLSPSVLQGRKEKRETGEGARSPTRTTMQCCRKVRVNGANIPAMFSRALWPFLSETIHHKRFLNVETPTPPQPPPPPLPPQPLPKPILTVKHGSKYCHPSWDHVASPLLFSSSITHNGGA